MIICFLVLLEKIYTYLLTYLNPSNGQDNLLEICIRQYQRYEISTEQESPSEISIGQEFLSEVAAGRNM
jgi:hypothetical protein